MTLTDIEADLRTNADWFATRSVSKANAYITAATIWLEMVASSASNQSSSMSKDTSHVANMRKEAMAFVAANPASSGFGGSVRFLGAGSNFR